MNRLLTIQLIKWKDDEERKPLILQGARQVGKTHLLKDFGENNFEDFVAFNFEEDPLLADFFTGKLTPTEILRKLSIYRNKSIVPGKTLVVFDEVQACPMALNSLKYFCEQAPEYHIAAAGSLLGIELHGKGSFPVGKVNFLKLFPLCFYEFLEAIGKSNLLMEIESPAEITPLPSAIHQELCELLRVFIFVGGMPEAVYSYKNHGDFSRVRKIQREIINAYLLDFSKHAEKSDVLKITRIWESIPAHLGKENKKFVFSTISKSSRAREYEHALQWLLDAGLIYKSTCVETPQIPLTSFQDNDTFKVFLLDTGLLGAMMRIQPATLITGNDLFTHAKGSLTENWVAQELSFHLQQPLHYWASKGTAEVDFLISILHHLQETILPLEVKSGESTKSKSLAEYGKKYKPNLLIRSGMLDLRKSEYILNVPLYQIGSLSKLLHLLADLSHRKFDGARLLLEDRE